MAPEPSETSGRMVLGNRSNDGSTSETIHMEHQRRLRTNVHRYIQPSLSVDRRICTDGTQRLSHRRCDSRTCEYDHKRIDPHGSLWTGYTSRPSGEIQSHFRIIRRQNLHGGHGHKRHRNINQRRSFCGRRNDIDHPDLPVENRTNLRSGKHGIRCRIIWSGQLWEGSG